MPTPCWPMVTPHRRLLDAVDADGCAVQVFNPDLAEHGFASEWTLVQIVHPDMPFLVDSGHDGHQPATPDGALDRASRGRGVAAG